MSIFNEKFKKMFPKIAEELEKGEMQILKIDAFRIIEEKDNTPNLRELTDPDVISFIRRCSTNEEAIEIIEFMVRRGEISKEYGEKLKKQLETKGLRSFGPKKTWGYYERTFRKV